MIYWTCKYKSEMSSSLGYEINEILGATNIIN